ncbi:MAG: alpha/beta hydrolase [Flavobacteriaceae bacterium]|nr:alpha/beta hydrolase [Flavobacteriaceae bacterium]
MFECIVYQEMNDMLLTELASFGRLTFVPASSDSKGTVLLLHGNSSSRMVYKNLLERGMEDAALLALELPGHGEKGREDAPKAVQVATYLKWVQTTIHGIGDCLLVGNSLGGHLAVECLNLKEVKGLVLMGTPPMEIPRDLPNAFRKDFDVSPLFEAREQGEEIVGFMKKLVCDQEHLGTILSDFRKTQPIVRTRIGASLMDGVWSDQRALFLGSNKPKFMLHGALDPLVSLEYLEEIHQLAQNSVLEIVPKCGHYPSLEQSNIFYTFLKKAIQTSFS